MQAATAKLGASEENLHSVQCRARRGNRHHLHQPPRQRGRLVVLKQNITTREETAQLASWRLQAGEADSLESSQAHSSLE